MPARYVSIDTLLATLVARPQMVIRAQAKRLGDDAGGHFMTFAFKNGGVTGQKSESSARW